MQAPNGTNIFRQSFWRCGLYLTNVQGIYTPSELVYGKNLRTRETLVMEHWMEPEEGDLVTEYMFKLINRLKRCVEVAINKMEEMQVKRKTWYDKNAVKREFKDGDLVLVLATSLEILKPTILTLK
ncbi:CCHC-type domain-containing protein [Trichonephila clavipes]|nr:CCHC-type domain-containing protein [Trichonephila clavipes]